jgi:hypothetical protein
VVGEVPEILVRMRLLSHQMEVFGASVMVVSHDLSMHLSLDRFVKQTLVPFRCERAAQSGEHFRDARPSSSEAVSAGDMWQREVSFGKPG